MENIVKSYDEFVNESYVGITGVDYKKAYTPSETEMTYLFSKYVEVDGKNINLELMNTARDWQIEEFGKNMKLLKSLGMKFKKQVGSKYTVYAPILKGYYSVLDHPNRDEGTNKQLEFTKNGHEVLFWSVALKIVEKGKVNIHNDRPN